MSDSIFAIVHEKIKYYLRDCVDGANMYQSTSNQSELPNISVSNLSEITEALRIACVVDSVGTGEATFTFSKEDEADQVETILDNNSVILFGTPIQFDLGDSSTLVVGDIYDIRGNNKSKTVQGIYDYHPGSSMQYPAIVCALGVNEMSSSVNVGYRENEANYSIALYEQRERNINSEWAKKMMNWRSDIMNILSANFGLDCYASDIDFKREGSNFHDAQAVENIWEIVAVIDWGEEILDAFSK